MCLFEKYFARRIISISFTGSTGLKDIPAIRYHPLIPRIVGAKKNNPIKSKIPIKYKNNIKEDSLNTFQSKKLIKIIREKPIPPNIICFFRSKKLSPPKQLE